MVRIGRDWKNWRTTELSFGRQPDQIVNYYAARCRALLFPGEEDFGMALWKPTRLAVRSLRIAVAARSKRSKKAKRAFSLINQTVAR
jgi:hypothetical protein